MVSFISDLDICAAAMRKPEYGNDKPQAVKLQAAGYIWVFWLVRYTHSVSSVSGSQTTLSRWCISPRSEAGGDVGGLTYGVPRISRFWFLVLQ